MCRKIHFPPAGLRGAAAPGNAGGMSLSWGPGAVNQAFAFAWAGQWRQSNI
jgi:hypothetical protein